MRKFLTAIMMVLFAGILLLSASKTKAEESSDSGSFVAEGSLGDSITWTLDKDGLMTFTGSGEIDDTNYGNQSWNNYMHDIYSLVIGEGITHIGDSAFGSAINLKSVTLPSTLKSIGNGAFYSNFALASIELPDGLETIGELAFSNCSVLEEITVPESVSAIGKEAFYNCFALTKAKLPDGLKVIEEECFYCCSSLETVNIPTGIEIIKDRAFYDCFEITSIELPEGLKEIGSYAFNCVGLTQLTFPSTLTSIGEQAFDAVHVNTLTIPDNVTTIGTGAFSDSWLVSVVLPSNMTELPDSMFSHTGLVRVYLPDGMTTIGEYAFSLCTNLTSIRIPATVDTIGNGAFSNCMKLKDVFYEGTEEEWKEISIGGNNFELGYATIHYNCLGRVDDPETAVTVPFHVGLANEGNQDIELTIPWDEELFLFDATVFHTELAIPCLILSGAVELDDWKIRIDTIMEKFGFDTNHLSDVNFDIDDNFLNVATVFGYRQITLQGETKNLFVIIARGTKTNGDVWTDLSSVGGGFAIASEDVLKAFQSFVKEKTGISYEELCKESSKNVLLVTGHSLGGAIADRLSVAMTDFAPKDKSFFYTFAPPCSFYASEVQYQKMTNVHDVINSSDKVPFLPPLYHHIGTQYWFNSQAGAIQSTFTRLTSGVNYWDKWKELPMGWFWTPHAVEVYMCYLIHADGNVLLTLYPITTITLTSSVDVDVYDADGNLVGRIADDAVDTSFPSSIALVTEEDKKYIILTEEGNYTLLMTGTDEGEMTYSVTTVDPETDEVLKEVVFSQVQLSDGKTMMSQVGCGSQEELQLYVVDENHEPIAEITYQGEEISLKEPEESSEPESSETESSEAEEGGKPEGSAESSETSRSEESPEEGPEASKDPSEESSSEKASGKLAGPLLIMILPGVIIVAAAITAIALSARKNRKKNNREKNRPR